MAGSEEIVYRAVRSGELEIRDDGTIWRIAARRGRRWKPGTRLIPCKPRRAENRLPSGYLQVRVMFDGTRHHALAHRLVWVHFNGGVRVWPGKTVNHINGVKDDNRFENLELATYSEQALHARNVLGRHPSLTQSGDQNHRAKLTWDKVEEMRALHAAGVKQTDLAERFGVAYQTVSKIVRNERWVKPTVP